MVMVMDFILIGPRFLGCAAPLAPARRDFPVCEEIYAGLAQFIFCGVALLPMHTGVDPEGMAKSRTRFLLRSSRQISHRFLPTRLVVNLM